MLQHYLVVAIRNLGRQRLHSALTIFVLALGLTCFLAASLFALYLGSYDTQFAKSERIYAIYQSSSWPQIGYRADLGRRSGFGLAAQLATDVPELEAVARQMWIGGTVSVDGRGGKQLGVAISDPAWLDIFDLRAVAGDTRGALARQGAAVLTAKTATALFGSTDVAGRTFTISATGSADVTVVAVVADIEGPSHLAFGVLSGGSPGLLASWDVFEKLYPQAGQQAKSLVFTNGTTYVLLPSDGSLTPQALDDRLRSIAQRPLPEAGATITLEARHVSTIAEDDLQKRFEGFQNGVPLPFAVAGVIRWLAVLVLVVACLNFVNLMTVRSMGRAREVGVRKSVGATSARIVGQDLFQTAFIVLIGIVVALLCLSAVAYLTENRWSVLIDVPWSQPALWALLTGVLVAVTAAAGLYPAALLARVHPVAALRLGTMKAGPRVLRSVLVVGQVGAAVFLGIVMLVVIEQGAVLRAALLGRLGDTYVLLPFNQQVTQKAGSDVIASELGASSAVRGVTAMTNYPFQTGGMGRSRVSRMPIDPAEPSTYESQPVSYDYFSVMQIPLLAGREYSRDYADDAMPTTREEFAARKIPFRVILDRKAALSLGWGNPADAVGQFVYTGAPIPSEVVGVVESVPLSIREQPSDGVVFSLNTQYASVFVVRIAGGATEDALAHVQDVWKKFMPDVPPVHPFLDEVFANVYQIFTLAGRVIAELAAFAVAIAVAGLFGMAAYVTRRRTREIGVRKSQGATPARILRLLLWDFSKPVLIGNVIAWPFAFMAARSYVDVFSEPLPLTPTPFVVALLTSLLVSWLAVGGYVWNAARVSPTIALRDE